MTRMTRMTRNITLLDHYLDYFWTTFATFVRLRAAWARVEGGELRVRLGGLGTWTWSRNTQPARYKPVIPYARRLLLQRLYHRTPFISGLPASYTSAGSILLVREDQALERCTLPG